jgi:hypothetical protein
MIQCIRPTYFCFALLLATPSLLYGQGTAFTYQGQLNDGVNSANGNYDFRFSLFNASTNGSATSGLVTNAAVSVASGLFTLTMDFGGSPFNGSSEWLNIEVRTNGGTSFTNLWPRQPLTPTPYAITAGTASNIVGVIPGSQLVTNAATSVILQGVFGGEFIGQYDGFTNSLPITLSNIFKQVATPINLAGGTNFSAGQISGGTWTNASVIYGYKTFYTNYTIATSDVVLDCTGTNQVITLLPAANFPPTTLLTIWSDNVHGSVTITNGTGFEAITVPGQGQGLAVLLGPANSPSNSVTLMVHGGHW